MKMHNRLIFILMIMLSACSNNSKQEKKNVSQKIPITNPTDSLSIKDKLVINDSADILKTVFYFKYKELDEGYLDYTEEIEVSSFYGSWTLTDISEVGGTMQKEGTIRNQIGNKLLFSKNKFTFNFFGKKYEIINPESYIETVDVEDGPNKGTTYSFGYRHDRKQIISLGIKNAEHFEIINYDELAFYFDGRIYFLHKD
jgi:hypothetical protein